MANINELLARAAALRDETQLNSIGPERAGGIMYETLLALNELWLQQGAALVISKIYASVTAMEADTSPVSDLTGKPIRPGMVVVIASSDSDNGSVYRYNGTSSPSWSLVGEIGNLEPVDSLDSDSTSLPLAAHQGKVLDGKISQLGQKVDANDLYFGDKHQGYISNGAWTDLTSGVRYYCIVPISSADGMTAHVKAPASQSSVICFLSTYNPVEGGDASVILQKIVDANTESDIVVPTGTKYIYVLASSPAERIPVVFSIADVDLLTLSKINVLNLGTKMERIREDVSQKANTGDVYLRTDKIIASGSVSLESHGNIAIVNVVADGGGTIHLSISGIGVVWSKVRIYPIKDGVTGTSETFETGEIDYIIPDGGITQIRMNISSSEFIASGVVTYSVGYLGISDVIDEVKEIVDYVGSAENVSVKGNSIKSGSTEITENAGKNFLIETNANIKKGDKIKISVSGIGTIISKFRVYFISTSSTQYADSPVILTAPFDTDYFRVGIGSGYYISSGTVNWSVERIGVNERLESLEHDTANTILDRNKDVDDIVFAGTWTNIYSTKEQIKLFTLLMSGDIHGRSTQMQSIIDYLNAKSHIDAGIMLGDLAGSNYLSDFSFYVPIVSQANKPFITIAGNHDMGSEEDPQYNAPSMEAFYDRYYAPTIPYAGVVSQPTDKCYFYKDFADYGIRMIMLNQYDYPDADLAVYGYQKGLAMYSQEQIDWFISVLNSTPADYGVIVALHMTPDKMIPYDCDFTSRNFRGKQSFAATSSTISGDIIADIVNAWISGGTLNEEYTITVTSALTGLTATADFTSRGVGEFICYIGGHWHNDIISHDFKYPTQLMLTVNNAACVARESDMPRLEGSKSEDSFFIVSVDRINKKVNIVSIGARMANDMVKRESIRLSY